MIPKRIVVMAGYAPSLVNFRGPLIRALLAQGHQVIAVAPGEAPEVQAQLSEWGAHYQPITLERTGLSLRKDMGDIWQLVKVLRNLQPDILLSYTIKPVVYGLLAARLAGVPERYALITGLGYTFQGTSLKRRLLSRGVGILYQAALNGAQRAIFQNEDDRDLFVRRGLVDVEKTVVVNGSGVDLRHYKPTSVPPQPVFLLIARLLREKGIGEYVEAARQIRTHYPQVRFQLAGPLDSNPAAIHQEELNDWVRQGIVEYLGELKDVRPALAACSVYVLPSYREGTPRTVLEAMATGRAIITTDAPGCRGTVQEGVNGLKVPVQNVPELVSAIQTFIRFPEQRQTMGQASLELVRNLYSVELVNQQMLTALGLLGPEHLGNPKTGSAVTPMRIFEKRLFDLGVSTGALLILALPLGLLALLVRFNLGSPVLFKQVRPGLHGQPFLMLKFRTMTDQRSPDGELLPDHLRLTSFGKFLRATSLDELPELLNVLWGDMSLVGPRPLLMEYLPLYSSRQARRHEVRPGITGWAQVNGRNALSWEEKFNLDVWYVENRTLALDWKILLLTVQKVFKREGISAQGEATMPRFTGASGRARQKKGI
ncbi:sugar transferase [Deinococcus fonticola]|uniref:sugar transferase n=1 Tax=Deinococcus fonticola TaxID=2528713 RepID=UPI00197A8C36|nr:sugar transferase [Deinococcus fonticola]